MASTLIKYVFLIGLVSTLQCADAHMKFTKEDKIQYNSTGLNPKEDVKFFLYTKNNPNNPKQLFVGDTDCLSKSDYDAKKRTKFYVHGWKEFAPEHAFAQCVPPVRKALLQNDVNVIAVEWKEIAAIDDYKAAVEKVLGIAQYFSKMIDFLVDQGSNPSRMLIVGHSTGAHIGGLASFNAKHKVGHIVGLDPAGPFFGGQDKNGRLTVDDAALVETIHTNTDLLGIENQIGKVDYYPNGGGSQPGCEKVQGKDKKETASLRGWCSHVRSCVYYSKSVKPFSNWSARRCGDYEKFKNKQCSKELIVPFVRDYPVIRPSGKYYLRTNGEHGLGKQGV